MTIRRTLLSGLMLLALLGAMQGGAALLGNRSLQRSMTVQTDRVAAVELVATAQLAFERADRAAQDSRRAPDPAAARSLAQRFRAEAAVLGATLATAAQLEPSLGSLVPLVDDWIGETDLHLPGGNVRSQTSLLREDLLADHRDARQREIAASVQRLLQGAVAARVGAAEGAQQVQTTVLACLALSVGGGLAIVLLLRRRVLRPLAILTKATGHLAAGELDRSVVGTSRRDEIGAVATALETLRLGTLHARTVEAQAAAERAAADAHIRHLAHHDPLTGVANRAKLRERLEHSISLARRAGSGVALLCLDLDRFKAVNDSQGHAAGDALLREAARRLLAATRDTDTVARLGGDEFVVVQTDVTRPDIAEQLARRLIESLGEPYPTGGGHQAVVTASVGITLFPGDGEDVDALLASADMAMYRIKQDGRNGYAFFRAEMDAEARARRLVEQDLRLAQKRGELKLLYQPQVDLPTGDVIGFEALLRWTHPQHGSVPPTVFIPVAEANGTIASMGAWVLREACAEAARWAKPLRIAVNVSPVQFAQSDMVAVVADALAATGLAPARLELEVTEGILIRDPARTLDALRRIRATGVSIALDDFGTGYSSLSTLRAFPFDRIKVDRSFVKDVATSHEAAAIVHAVLGLARGLGLPVVAEGVEDRDQLALLRTADCAEVQGYLFGRPSAIDNFVADTHPVPADYAVRQAAA